MSEEVWKKRFYWVWNAATDGLSYPDGWKITRTVEPTEFELQEIDKFIEDGK